MLAVPGQGQSRAAAGKGSLDSGLRQTWFHALLDAYWLYDLEKSLVSLTLSTCKMGIQPIMS